MPASGKFDLLIRLALFAILAVLAGATEAAPPRISGVKAVPRAIMTLERDYVASLNTDDSPIRPGVTVDVQLLSGKSYTGLEIAEMKAGPMDNTFRTLSFKPSRGNPSKLAPNTLQRLTTPENSFDVVIDPAAKAWLLIDQKKRDDVAAERLQRGQSQLWETPTREELDEATKFYDDLLAKVQAEFPQRPFQRVETRYFVFYTDMPAAQVGGYIANLDKMYDQLCVLFGIPAGTNIWLGKCPIIAFLDKPVFQQFEARHLDNPNTEGVAGLCHSWSDGRVVITCARGNDPVYFAVVLVHETAHGFMHRIRSSARIPLWLNEGLAEWIAGVVVTQSDHISNKMTGALPAIRQTGTLGGNYFDEEGHLDAWQYGVAATMTQFLLSTDANAYRGLLTAIKEGYSWNEALELTYGISPEELVIGYGRQLGYPALKP